MKSECQKKQRTDIMYFKSLLMTINGCLINLEHCPI